MASAPLGTQISTRLFRHYTPILKAGKRVSIPLEHTRRTMKKKKESKRGDPSRLAFIFFLLFLIFFAHFFVTKNASRCPGCNATDHQRLRTGKRQIILRRRPKKEIGAKLTSPLFASRLGPLFAPSTPPCTISSFVTARPATDIFFLFPARSGVILPPYLMWEGSGRSPQPNPPSQLHLQRRPSLSPLGTARSSPKTDS